MTELITDNCLSRRQLLHVPEAAGDDEDRAKKECVVGGVDDEAAGHRSRFGADQGQHAADDKQHQQWGPCMGELSFMEEGEDQGIDNDCGKQSHAAIQSRIEKPAKEKFLKKWSNKDSKHCQQPGRTSRLEKLIDGQRFRNG